MIAESFRWSWVSLTLATQLEMQVQYGRFLREKSQEPGFTDVEEKGIFSLGLNLQCGHILGQAKTPPGMSPIK